MLPALIPSATEVERLLAIRDEAKRAEEYRRLCELKLQRACRRYSPRDLFDFVVRWKTLADDLESLPEPAAPGTTKASLVAVPLGDQVSLHDQVKRLIVLLVKEAANKGLIRDGRELVDAAIRHMDHSGTPSAEGTSARTAHHLRAMADGLWHEKTAAKTNPVGQNTGAPTSSIPPQPGKQAATNIGAGAENTITTEPTEENVRINGADRDRTGNP